jgi:acyl-CoA synthetase (AMP-forming)/AMP-acid ligase II
MGMAVESGTLDVLTRLAQERRDKPAVVDDRPDGTVRTFTFDELNRAVNRVANGLAAHGVGAGQRVVWAGRNSIDALVVQHAIRKLGGFAVPLNHRLSAAEAEAIVGAANASVIWAEAEFAGLFAAARARDLVATVVFDGAPGPGQVASEQFLADASEEEPPPVERRGFDGLINFTSGTTGKPKGVVRYALGTSEHELLSGIWGSLDHVFVVTGSLSHGGPNGHANRTLLGGGTVVLQRRFDALDWLRLVDRYGVTITYSAPAPMLQITSVEPERFAAFDTSSLTTVIAAAAQWPYALKQAFVARFPACGLWELYGSTELASNLVMAPADQLRKPGSCGTPVPGVDVILVDENDNVVTEPGVRGVLYARSDSIFHGYEGDDEAYNAARRGDHFTVGDVAYFDEDGYYYICDRVKDMVVSGGVNVYPLEIEGVLAAHPGIFESAVIGVPSDEWGEAVHAVVVPRPGVVLSEQDVVAHCRTLLASHKVPRTVEFVDELPHLLSGKVAKRELRAAYWAGAGRSI